MGSQCAVLMPTLNAQRYLAEAIESILDQSLTAFDLLILDGGSDDATLDIAKALQRRDTRISIISTPGTSPSRRINEALDTLSHDYLVMAHADDVSVRHRLAKQVAFMAANPALVMSGSDTHFWLHEKSGALDIDHYSGRKTYPADHDAIMSQLCFWWCFSVASVILNGAAVRALKLRFDDSLKTCSDWWFNWQAAQAGMVANLPEPLIAYRHHHSSHGPRELSQIALETRIVRERIACALDLWPTLSEDEREAFHSLSIECDGVRSIGDPDATKSLLLSLAPKLGWPLISRYYDQLAKFEPPSSFISRLSTRFRFAPAIAR
ncbi:glycosyltransferase [uncultured Methylovirgula sp.]|uniref:glycosyltransferase family 2 protein n=1 Tax=uncultured Methylovirgula sp. TaxID=1285960 RepID=UPI0026333818|nr:glycosyltransferase [uncultured Methylovirgula sp.]